MMLLLLVSLLWAFSFGLIGTLKGLDLSVVAALRLLLALLLLAPWLRGGRVPAGLALRLLPLGALQFGLMYLLYMASFAHLPSHQVALFTLLTPVHIALLAHARDGRRAWRPLLAALLAVASAAVVTRRGPAGAATWTGFALVQGSNLCFAAGQLGYRRVMRSPGGAGDAPAMVWMYAGGLLATLLPALHGWRTHGFPATPHQWAVIAYLGFIASGLGFLLWNRGARRVSAATLAVLNNAKVPLAVAVSLLLFRETADPWRLGAALLLLGVAVWLCEARRGAA